MKKYYFVKTEKCNMVVSESEDGYRYLTENSIFPDLPNDPKEQERVAKSFIRSIAYDDNWNKCTKKVLKKGVIIAESVEMCRELDKMPFDKVFEYNGNECLCHATGLEVCLGDPYNACDWWNEYVLPDGTFEYGR